MILLHKEHSVFVKPGVRGGRGGGGYVSPYKTLLPDEACHGKETTRGNNNNGKTEGKRNTETSSKRWRSQWNRFLKFTKCFDNKQHTRTR